MNGKGIALLAVAVVAIGTFALPSTVSLFSGQHTWYDLGSEGNDVPCEKCHADVAEEMNALTGPHTGETGYERLKCEYCHRTFKIEQGDTNPSDSEASGYDQYPDVNLSLEAQYLYTYGSGDGSGATPGKQAHAASTIPCMYCHSGGSQGIAGNHGSGAAGFDCLSCHGNPHEGRYTNAEDCRRCHANAITKGVYDVPPAGGFNLTANSSDTGELAAHKTFVMNSISNPQMEDANEACIACHTGIPVNITWKHAHDLNFTATWEGGLFPTTPTHFNVSDWNVNGTVTNYSYGYGNGTGSTSSSGWYQGE